MPRILKARTTAELNELSHYEGDHYVGGTVGLFLRVRKTTSGFFTRTWYVVDQRYSKRKVYSLHRHYPECSLRVARELALKKREMLSPTDSSAFETTPTTSQSLALLAQIHPHLQPPIRITVEQAMMEYLDVKEKTWKKGATERERTEAVWRKHLKTILNRFVYEIEIRDMEECLRKCHAENYPTYAKHLPRFGQFFQWATYKGYRTRDQINPCDKETLSLLLPKPADDGKSHAHPALPIELIPEFFAELIKEDSISAFCLMFLILTGVRPGNSATAQWSQFNSDFTEWTVKATNMKITANGQHKVPLSTQATKLLQCLKVRATSSIYVFPSPQLGHGSISTTTMTSLVRRMHTKRLKEGKPGWIDPELSEQWNCERIIVPHGTARAGISTWNFEYNISDKRTIDLILHHVVSDYQGAYDRAKNMKSKKRTLQLWADYCFSQIDLNSCFPLEPPLVELPYTP